MIRRAVIPVVLAAVAVLAAAAPAAAAPACDDGRRIDAARAYVEALAGHDAADVPLHRDATRPPPGVPEP